MDNIMDNIVHVYYVYYIIHDNIVRILCLHTLIYFRICLHTRIHDARILRKWSISRIHYLLYRERIYRA